MICNNCGSQIDEGQKFCAKCGAPVNAKPQEAYRQPDVNYSASAQPRKLNVFLLVISIVLIVFGAIATALSCVTVVPALSALGELIPGEYKIALVIELIASILWLLCGIFGCVWNKKYEKAGILILLGVIAVALRIIDIILCAMIGVGVSPISFFGIVILVLYVFGGLMNKKAAAA